MAGFMKKSLGFKTRKWRRQFVPFRRCHRWASGATVVVMSETANICFLSFFHLHIARESCRCARGLHRSRWGNLCFCSLWLAISERTMFAFFSLLTVVFLALWFETFSSLTLRLAPAMDCFHYVTDGIFALWFSPNQMFFIKFSVSFATAVERARPSHVFIEVFARQKT